MKFSRYIFVIFVMLYLVSCSGKTAVKAPLEEFDAEKSFAKANKLIDDKEYTEARAILLEIKNRDLSKKFAPLAQLRIADSYIKEDDTDLAVTEYRKFIEIYPDHRYASYAQYEIAMAYFNQIEGPDRGYGGAAKALAEFEKLKKDFPRNPYKDVVDLRIEKCRNIIADYELMVSEYYIKKGSFNAAIGRLEGLIKSYPDYKKIERVLFDLGVSYKKIGKNEKAEENLKLLLEKYPNSPATKEAKKELSSIRPVKK
jgi:outer membrane protein assembly factor BamD